MIKIIKVSGFENEVVEKLSLKDERRLKMKGEGFWVLVALYIIRWWMVKERMCC